MRSLMINETDISRFYGTGGNASCLKVKFQCSHNRKYVEMVFTFQYYTVSAVAYFV